MTSIDDLVTAFRNKFPEFDSPSGKVPVTDVELREFLKDAQQLYSANDNCTLYLAAHLIALKTEMVEDGLQGKTDSGSGEISQDAVNGIQREVVALATDNPTEAFYTTSLYGRTFWILRRADPTRTISVRVF